MDDITPQTVAQSLDTHLNRASVFKAGESNGGASGSFFFFSHDKNFIIKTCTEEEKDFFIEKIATDYFEYVRQNPRSFLARIYGIYTVKI